MGIDDVVTDLEVAGRREFETGYSRLVDCLLS
jgi:hypothetical protein